MVNKSDLLPNDYQYNHWMGDAVASAFDPGLSSLSSPGSNAGWGYCVVYFTLPRSTIWYRQTANATAVRSRWILIQDSKSSLTATAFRSPIVGEY